MQYEKGPAVSEQISDSRSPQHEASPSPHQRAVCSVAHTPSRPRCRERGQKAQLPGPPVTARHGLQNVGKPHSEPHPPAASPPEVLPPEVRRSWPDPFLPRAVPSSDLRYELAFEADRSISTLPTF